MKKTAPTKHRREDRMKDGELNEILIWHGEQCVFHLKRMAADFIWFGTYIDNKGEDVEIKIGDGALAMNGKESPKRKTEKPKPTPGENKEEMKPETKAVSSSEPAT